MSSDRRKNTAEWFYSLIFKDEKIPERTFEKVERDNLKKKEQKKADRLPSLLRAARSLEKSNFESWQTREKTFIKQGKLLADYEDDYIYELPVQHYFPTYQSLSDPELRAYFSWRTKIRKGKFEITSQTFAYLYIYELLNQIGVSDAMDGYEKICQFRDHYGELDDRISVRLEYWLQDYVIYYGLDSSLLADYEMISTDKALCVFADIQNQEPQQIMEAVGILSSGWLERSRFYNGFREDYDLIMSSVLKKMDKHYATKCKRGMMEQFFGPFSKHTTTFFLSAVFDDSHKRKNCEYVVDPVRIYRCTNGVWSVEKYDFPQGKSVKLGHLVRSVDGIMREMYGYKHPIRYQVDAKWLEKLIREEVQLLIRSKEEAESKKIHIDLSKLEKIRADAVVTRDKLIVEEEEEGVLVFGSVLPETTEITTNQEIMSEDENKQSDGAVSSAVAGLSEWELRLLRCLLNEEDCGWVHSSGLIMSVLVDGINEKLYDEFLDSVLLMDSEPELIEDYVDDLKEMVLV